MTLHCDCLKVWKAWGYLALPKYLQFSRLTCMQNTENGLDFRVPFIIAREIRNFKNCMKCQWCLWFLNYWELFSFTYFFPFLFLKNSTKMTVRPNDLRCSCFYLWFFFCHFMTILTTLTIFTQLLFCTKSQGNSTIVKFEIKFIYSEKATKFCEISTVDLSYVVPVKYYGWDFAKFCGLLRIYEL